MKKLLMGEDWRYCPQGIVLKVSENVPLTTVSCIEAILNVAIDEHKSSSPETSDGSLQPLFEIRPLSHLRACVGGLR